MANKSITVSDQIILPLGRDLVWEKLNDPEILARCIRGCSAVEKQGNDFTAVITAKLSGYQKDFNVDLIVNAADAPEFYQLSSAMSAGLFGKATALADVQLTVCGEAQEQTELNYQANIDASGMLGKALPLGQSLAEKRVRECFELFRLAATS